MRLSTWLDGETFVAHTVLRAGCLRDGLRDCCGANMDTAAIKLLSLVVLIECWQVNGQGQVKEIIL